MITAFVVLLILLGTSFGVFLTVALAGMRTLILAQTGDFFWEEMRRFWILGFGLGWFGAMVLLVAGMIGGRVVLG